MQPIQIALSDMIRLFVQKGDEVVVSEILPPANGFEIKVSLIDYHAVLSKIHAIKILAMRLAGVPEGETLIINLVVNENGPSFPKQTTRS